MKALRIKNSSRSRTAARRGFTLLEMMITLAIFILLAAAVFGLMSGVIESSSTLQDNQNRRDEITALNAYMKKKLTELPADSSLISYQRGDGEGLLQNGIVFGTISDAMVFDAKVQPNGYYVLRQASYTTSGDPNEAQDARTYLQQAASTDDPTLIWTTLMGDLKTLDWKFLDFNSTLWVDLWPNSAKPNLVEFTTQPAGELQPVTMDFWVPKIDAMPVGGNRGAGS
jgi:prepilin-type N-terminal cleavage/methylation domain-containing protein